MRRWAKRDIHPGEFLNYDYKVIDYNADDTPTGQPSHSNAVFGGRRMCRDQLFSLSCESKSLCCFMEF